MSSGYYRILGIEIDATLAQVKTAFRKIARIAHPDVAGADPELTAFFTAASEAYEVLRDPERRARYDARHSRKRGSFAEAFQRRASARDRERKGTRWGAAEGSDNPFSDFFGEAEFSRRQREDKEESEEPIVSPPVMVSVPVGVAVLGGPVSFRAPDGRALTMQIPKASQPGDRVQLSQPENDVELVVVLRVVIPPDMSEESVEKLTSIPELMTPL
jgi:DnaJ-class molecular chaperone